MARELSDCVRGALIVAVVAGCGNKQASDFGGRPGSGGADSGNSGGLYIPGNGNSGNIVIGMMGNGDADASSDAEAADPNCAPGIHTTVSGVVYDPGLQDPLFNITVFAPKSLPLNVLPKGASCNTCDSLFPPFYGSAVTDSHGHFILPNVPPGANVPVVVQTGKWRKTFMIPNVTKCVDNPQPDKTLRLPKNGTKDGDLPDIAISTGHSDSLECLLLRIGVDPTEWTPGPGGMGHIHIFVGNGADTMPASPASSQSLWGPNPSFKAYDVTLLSCEGGETRPLGNPDRQALLDYANAGGRVFASHFHYFWFAPQGPWATMNLATWYRDQQGFNDPGPSVANVYTTRLNGTPFPEGVALQQWLGFVGALDGNGQLPIYYPRHNADVLPPVGPAATPSQPWIVLDKSVMSFAPPMVAVANGAQYFSVDTPLGAAQPCGRVVYSDLHVSGGPGSTEPGSTIFMPDYPAIGNAMGGGVVPTECAMHPLTPQEKALEFMIFDLSSCLIPIGQATRPPR